MLNVFALSLMFPDVQIMDANKTADFTALLAPCPASSILF